MKGYAYIDDYGFEHVVDTIDTAKQYSGNGKVYEVECEYKNGYAQLDGKRARVCIPGSKEYGNAPTEGTPVINIPIIEV